MLGKALIDALGRDFEIIGLYKKPRPSPCSLKPQGYSDITSDITDASVIDNIICAKPDIIIHTAAKTNVDDCEINPDEAYKINAQGTENVAKAAKESKAAIIYLSTDYVFDGEKALPYKEDDAPDPICVYGRAKLKGEEIVSKLAHSAFFIVRTSCLFGEGRTNFVSTIVSSIKNKKVINVWQDQIGSPTYTKDLASAIYKIVRKRFSPAASGIYHITNTGSCSRYELAKKVLEYFNVDDTILNPLMCRDDNHPARRPLLSALDNHKYQDTFGETMRGWETALKEYLSTNYEDLKREAR